MSSKTQDKEWLKLSNQKSIAKIEQRENKAVDYPHWILITKQFEIVGRLEHPAYNTRDKARSWFLGTVSMVNTLDRLEDSFYVISNKEYDFLKELSGLDSLLNEEIN